MASRWISILFAILIQDKIENESFLPMDSYHHHEIVL